MKVLCWHCGEEVKYRYFGKAKEVRCPCCHQPVFRQLGVFESLYNALLSVSASGLAVLVINQLSNAGFEIGMAVLAGLLGLFFLSMPLIRRMAYAIWVRHYDTTGVESGKYIVPCWKCGKSVEYYYGERTADLKCPSCNATVFEAVHGRSIFFTVIAYIAVMAAMIGVLYHWSSWAGMSQIHYLLLMLLCNGVAGLLSLPGYALENRAYRRWLGRYGDGLAKAPQEQEQESRQEAIEKTK